MLFRDESFSFYVFMLFLSLADHVVLGGIFASKVTNKTKGSVPMAMIRGRQSLMHYTRAYQHHYILLRTPYLPPSAKFRPHVRQASSSCLGLLEACLHTDVSPGPKGRNLNFTKYYSF